MDNQVNECIEKYKPIDIIYTDYQTVSPLQRWNGRVIDLDKIVEIPDVEIISDWSNEYNRLIEIKYFQIMVKCQEVNIDNNIIISYSPTLYEKEVTKEYFENNHFSNYFFIDYGKEKLRELRKVEFTKNSIAFYQSGYRFFERYLDLEKDKQLIQSVILNDLIKVWRLYKEGK